MPFLPFPYCSNSIKTKQSRTFQVIIVQIQGFFFINSVSICVNILFKSNWEAILQLCLIFFVAQNQILVLWVLYCAKSIPNDHQLHHHYHFLDYIVQIRKLPNPNKSKTLSAFQRDLHRGLKRRIGQNTKDRICVTFGLIQALALAVH